MNPDKLGDFSIKMTKYKSIGGLIVGIIFFIIFIGLGIYFIFTEMIWYSYVGAFIFGSLILFSSIMSVIRIFSAKSTSDQNPNKNLVEIASNEEIVAKYAGVLWMGGGLNKKSLWSVRSVSYFGVGKVNHPENSIIITNKKIIFIFIPSRAGNLDVSNMDVGQWQIIFSAKEIKQKLEELLKSRTLKEVANIHKSNFPLSLSEIKNIRFDDINRFVTFETKKERIKYAVRYAEDLESMKQLLSPYISNA